MSVRRFVSVAIVTACTVLGSVFVTGPAQAIGGPLSGRCPSGPNGDFCLYYNSYAQGAMHEWYVEDPDFAGETFWGTGLPGNGYPVKNDAASGENGWTTEDGVARVCFNSHFLGGYDLIYPGRWYNLAITYNENASFWWWLEGTGLYHP